MKIKLKKYFNSSMLINPEKAKNICDKLKDIFKKEDKIILDFSGIKAVTLVFLFVLFTNLWKIHGNNLKHRLLIRNISKNFLSQILYLKTNYKELQKKFLGVYSNFELAYIN